MYKVTKSLILCVLIFSNYSCASGNNINSVQNNLYINSKFALKGRVQFPNEFKIKANTDDISKGATVSILSNDLTVATGLTDEYGYFTINLFSNFNPQANEIFTLQASRRVDNNENISISTLLKWMPPAHTGVALMLFAIGGGLGLLAGFFGGLTFPHSNGERGFTG